MQGCNPSAATGRSWQGRGSPSKEFASSFQSFTGIAAFDNSGPLARVGIAARYFPTLNVQSLCTAFLAAAAATPLRKAFFFLSACLR
jgi:hypothetical protein